MVLLVVNGGIDMASSSGSNLRNEDRSARETRKAKRKLDSYARPIPLLHQQMFTFQEWPDWEKEALLAAMKKYGHYDLESICRAVPGKSKENIKIVINTWWKSARSAMMASANGKRNIDDFKGARGPGRPPNLKNTTSAEKVPIDQWLFKMENNQTAAGFNQSKLLARMFLYISKYESHPSPEECNGVDFKALYEYLYCMLNGFPGKDLNARTSAFLLNTLQELAIFIKDRGMSQEISFLERTQRITGQDKQVRTYGGKKKKLVENVVDPNSDEGKFKKFLEIPGFNPMIIKAEVLKK